MTDLPPLAAFCDAHVHVVGDPAHYPLDASRTYRPGPASLARLEDVARPHGVDRFVIVQPSFYGTDNALLLDTLDALGERGRGVAVVEPGAVAERDLDRMAGAGVRGLRINLYSAAGPGGPLADLFAANAAVARARGWHVQVIAPLPLLAAAADVLRGSPVPVVIDHYGLPGGVAPGAPARRALLDLARRDHVWIKLSAPYRGGDPLAVDPDPDWLGAILEAAPDRCVWGSDWPHTPVHERGDDPDHPAPYRALDYGAVLAGFRAALPEGAAAAVLRDNPARLYGFPPAA